MAPKSKRSAPPNLSDDSVTTDGEGNNRANGGNTDSDTDDNNSNSCSDLSSNSSDSSEVLLPDGGNPVNNVIKPVLPPRPTRPQRGVLQNININNPKTLLAYKRVLLQLKNKHDILITTYKASNDEWATRDRCGSSHLDNLHATCIKLAKGVKKLGSVNDSLRNQLDTMRKEVSSQKTERKKAIRKVKDEKKEEIQEMKEKLDGKLRQAKHLRISAHAEAVRMKGIVRKLEKELEVNSALKKTDDTDIYQKKAMAEVLKHRAKKQAEFEIDKQKKEHDMQLKMKRTQEASSMLSLHSFSNGQFGSSFNPTVSFLFNVMLNINY